MASQFISNSIELFEDEQFDYQTKRQWLRSHWAWSVAIGVAYLLAVHFGRKFMQDRKPFALTTPLFIWNVALAVFSTVGTWRTLPELLKMLKDGGLHGAICDEGGLAHRGHFGQWVWFFCVSKVIELVDTFFLVARKRPVVFIHWYHHVTVLAFTWYTNSGAISAGRWYLVMNFGVHAVMYTYYAMRTVGVVVPRAVAMIITGLQVTQMLIGFWVTLYAAARAWDGPMAPGGKCETSAANAVAGLVLYGSYFLLFFRLFIKSYMTRAAPVLVNGRKPLSARWQQPSNAYNGHHCNGNHGIARAPTATKLMVNGKKVD